MHKKLLKFGLSIGLSLCTVALAHADPAKLKKFIYDIDQTPTVLYVKSNDGVSWNELKPGNVFIHAKILVDTYWPGFVYHRGVGIVLGSCVGAACLEQPIIWAARNSPITGAAHTGHDKSGAYGRDYFRDPVVTPVPVSKILDDDRSAILARCNEQLAANGPTIAHKFEYDLDSTLVADTGQQWTILSALIESPGPGLSEEEVTESFFPEQVNHWKTASFKIQVNCVPVVSSASDDVVVDFGEFKVTDLELFLSTYSNADSQPNPATTCKKGQIKVRLKTSKAGLAHFKLWKKVGNAPATSTNIAVQAQPDGDGGFQAEHVEWISVDVTSTLQAKAEELTDPNGKVTGWESLLLQCKAIGEGGGIAPDMSDYEAKGSLTIFSASGSRCPRAGQVGIGFTSNYNQKIDYGLTCTNGINVNGSLNPGKVGDDWKAQDTVQFQIKKTEGMGCTLWHHRAGKKTIAAFSTGEFACKREIVTGVGSGGLKPAELPDTERPKTDWQGTVTVANTARSNTCPRKEDKVIFDVSRTQPGSFSYYLGCSNGDFFNGTMAPVQSGGVYKAIGAHSLSVSKTRKIQCTLQEVKPGGAKATIAVGENQFNCSPGPVAGAGSDQLSPPSNEPSPGVPSAGNETTPPAQVTGELKFGDGRGKACPRQAKVVVAFKHPQSNFGNMFYSLKCTGENGRLERTGVASAAPSTQGGFYAPRDEKFELTKSTTYSCRLHAGTVPVDSSYKAYAAASHTFTCAKPPVTAGGGVKVAPAKPGVDRERAERIKKAKIAEERRRRAKAAAEKRRKQKAKAERLRNARAAAERQRKANAAAERRKKARAAAERRKRAKAQAERRKRARVAAARKKRARARAAQRRKARAASERRRKLRAKTQRRRAIRARRRTTP